MGGRLERLLWTILNYDDNSTSQVRQRQEYKAKDFAKTPPPVLACSKADERCLEKQEESEVVMAMAKVGWKRNALRDKAGRKAGQRAGGHLSSRTFQDPATRPQTGSTVKPFPEILANSNIWVYSGGLPKFRQFLIFCFQSAVLLPGLDLSLFGNME